MKSVLVVDDHPVVRMALANALSSQTDLLFVGEAASQDEALALARQMPPDLVVLDMMLGESDGLMLIRHLRKLDPELRVLVFSMRNDAVHIARARREGASGYVAKSASMEVLLQTIRAVLSGFQVFPDSDNGKGSDMAMVEPAAQLSRRELTVLSLMCRGLRNKDIADSLFLSPKTISTYKSRMQEKLGLDSTLDLIDYARLHGLE